MSVDCPPQQTTDNADQIGEIEERVQSLRKVLESPVGDRDNEEKARRGALRKSVMPPSTKIATFLNQIGFRRKLDSIIAKLKPLSERHGIVKFLKNANHAKTLNGFVRDLDTAVTDYQVCATIDAAS